MFWDRVQEGLAGWVIPRLDGRVVITSRIAEDYAAGKHYVMIDGGVAPEIISQLPPLEKPVPETAEFVLVFAGSLDEVNGIQLILDAFALLKDATYRLWIAGQGPLKEVVLEASRRDQRIVYRGMLTMDQVMKMYGEANVLLNIRPASKSETPYCFPSKLIEYFAVGRLVITTAVAHAAKEYAGFGLFLNIETPDALAQLIEQGRRMGVVQRTDFGSRARDYMVKNKLWAKQGERIAKYLAEHVLQFL
jgi:glycosyltransferase involved in cell wall biosynthesis